jgi:DNA-binding GntR family transcriptional regulator
LPLKLRGLAERLNVSRAHIGNLLGEAEAAGWIRIADSRLTALDPTLLTEFEDWAAGQMLFYDDLAAAILAEPKADAATPRYACAS